MPSASRPIPGNRKQSGATTVELALILPMLLLMLFGILDIANMLRIQVTLHSATANMARQIALDSTVRTQSSAAAYMIANKLLPEVTQDDNRASDPTLTLSPENPTCTSSSCTAFEVGITYTYYAITPLTKPFFDGIVLSASVKKTAEPGT
jgi:Flp pilus assembly protein TadG